MDNENIIEATENVNELVAVTATSNNTEVIKKVGIGAGILAGVTALVTFAVKKTKNWRIKIASKYLEKNGKLVIDSYGDIDLDDAENVNLYDDSDEE